MDLVVRYSLIVCGLGDHIFGLAPLMAGCMNGAGGMVDGVADPRNVTPNPEPVMVSFKFKMNHACTQYSSKPAIRDIRTHRNTRLRP